MPKCTRDNALSIALNYLGHRYAGNLEVQDGLSKGQIAYPVNSPKDVWVIPVPCEKFQVGPSKILCISKESGEIVYFGAVGD